MRKIAFLVIAFLMSVSLQAREEIIFSTNAIDDKELNNPGPKSPIEVPLVYIEDYTLTFEVGHPDYALTIKDEDGDVVYTTVVTSAQTTVVLPSTLSGNYVIELVTGNWLFTGYIIL